jgi:hypothetical protein
MQFGLMILMNGYHRPLIGLSGYRWHVAVHLAWFSSLVQPLCRTFLRNFLYDDPVGRGLRLTCTGIPVFVLVVAISPPGGFVIEFEAPASAIPKPTICYH